MEKKLTRDIENKIIGGVVAGVAKYLGHDVTLWRLATVVGLICTGFAPIGVIYIVAWIIMPPSGDEQPQYDYDVR